MEPDSGTFCGHLKTVLSRSNVLNREWEPNEDYNDRFVITRTEKRDELLLGYMIGYEQGSGIETYSKPPDPSLEPKTGSILLGTNDDGWPMEVIEATLFFAILGNHVALVQSARIKASHFESHVNWLFQQFSNQDQIKVSLKREISKKLNDLINDRMVKQISFKDSANLFMKGHDGNENTDTTSSPSRKIILNPEIWDKLLESSPDLKKLFGSGFLKDVTCELVLKIKKKNVDYNQSLIRAMVNVFEPENFNKFKVDFYGHGCLSGSNLILSKTFPIETVNRRPLATDIFNKLEK